MMPESSPSWAASLRRRGIDAATLYATLAQSTSLCLGPITVLFVANSLQPEIQGYYYTFGSLTAVQVVFGAGLSQVVMQAASHEWPHAGLHGPEHRGGNPGALGRLSSIWSTAFRWYLGLSVALAAALVWLGWAMFAEQGAHDGVRWELPWLALGALTCVNFVLTPAWALLQGCGQVRQYYLFHWVHLVLSAVTLWVTLSYGFELWAAPASVGVGAAWGALFLCARYRRFFKDVMTAPRDRSLNWAHEMWPLQWRSWLSWLSTTLTIQALVPISFRVSGPATAGQLGMTITLTSVIAAVASNAVSTKAPRLGALVAQGRFSEMDALFRRAAQTSSLLLAATTGLALAALAVAESYGVRLADRLLPAAPFVVMLAAAAGTAVSGWLSTYVRAFKREPFAFPYAVWSLGTLLLVTTASRPCGTAGIANGYLAGVAGLLLPATSFIFLRYRRTHAPAQAADPTRAAAAGRGRTLPPALIADGGIPWMEPDGIVRPEGVSLTGNGTKPCDGRARQGS